MTKEILYNEGELLIDELEEVKRKVRAIVFNPKGEILLAYYAGMYMLPGGSIDDGEKPLDALDRELREESGIRDYDVENAPFLTMKDFIRDYPNRDGISHNNRLTETLFYIVNTSQNINVALQKLTSSEKKQGFKIFFVDPNKIEELIDLNKTDNLKKAYFERELKTVLKNVTLPEKKYIKTY